MGIRHGVVRLANPIPTKISNGMNGTGISTGWFGIPGAKGRGSTKVHVVICGKPACGTKVGEYQEYQKCVNGADSRIVECKRCFKDVNDRRLKATACGSPLETQ
jgi:hypothetical protein